MNPTLEPDKVYSSSESLERVYVALDTSSLTIMSTREWEAFLKRVEAGLRPGVAVDAPPHVRVAKTVI